MSKAKWYISLGEGTWAILDELPYVFLATDEQIKKIEDDESLVSNDCEDDGHGAFLTHIHIFDLLIDTMNGA